MVLDLQEMARISNNYQKNEIQPRNEMISELLFQVRFLLSFINGQISIGKLYDGLSFPAAEAAAKKAEDFLNA